MREEVTLPETTREKFLQLAELLKQASFLARDISHNSESLNAAIPKDQRWFWTKEWQAVEHEVDEQLARGHYQDFNSVEELIADLNQNV